MSIKTSVAVVPLQLLVEAHLQVGTHGSFISNHFERDHMLQFRLILWQTSVLAVQSGFMEVPDESSGASFAMCLAMHFAHARHSMPLLLSAVFFGYLKARMDLHLHIFSSWLLSPLRTDQSMGVEMVLRSSMVSQIPGRSNSPYLSYLSEGLCRPFCPDAGSKQMCCCLPWIGKLFAGMTCGSAHSCCLYPSQA